MVWRTLTAQICDSSVWLALAVSGHVHHSAAQLWLDAVQEQASVIFCRNTQQSFLRLLTTVAVQAPYGDPPLTNASAWAMYEAFIADERIVFRQEEPDGLHELWRQFTARPSASPKLWMDAYLAAFAVAGGCRMVTTDAAYRQFNGLDLVLLGQSPS